MRALVADAMCQGALGLSTGLFYAPQSFATTDEVVALAREAAQRGGVYDSHIRDESSYTIGLAAAVDEAIAIGREARLPVHISPHQGAGRRRAGPGAGDHRQDRGGAARPGRRSPPINIPGPHRARAWSPRWCRAGRRTAGARRCCGASTIRRSTARLRADMAENLRRRGGAGSAADHRGRAARPARSPRSPGDAAPIRSTPRSR